MGDTNSLLSSTVTTPLRDYKFTVSGDTIISCNIKPIESGSIKWGIKKITNYDKTISYYLDGSCTIKVPKGIDFLLITVPYLDGKPIAKFTMFDSDNATVWIICDDTTSSSVIHVSNYSTTTEDAMVEYNLALNSNSIEVKDDKKTIELSYSYDINKKYNNTNKDIIEDLKTSN